MKVFIFGILYFYSLCAFSGEAPQNIEEITFDKVKEEYDKVESAKLAEIEKIENEKKEEQAKVLREELNKTTLNLSNFNEYYNNLITEHEAKVEAAKAEKESCEKLSLNSVSIVSNKCKDYDGVYQTLKKSKPDLKQSFDKMKDEARILAIDIAKKTNKDNDIEQVRSIESSVEMELSTEELLCQKQSETCDKPRLTRLKDIQLNVLQITDPAKYEAVKNEMVLPKKEVQQKKTKTAKASKEKRRTFETKISKSTTQIGTSKSKNSDVSVKLRPIAQKTNAKAKKDRSVAKEKKQVAKK